MHHGNTLCDPLKSLCRLQIDIVQRRVDLMAAEGVRFVTNAHVGKVRLGVHLAGWAWVSQPGWLLARLLACLLAPVTIALP